jgi:hypothetical protein
MRRRVEEREIERREAAPVALTSAGSAARAGVIARLQREAGNHAVAALLARAPAGLDTEPHEGGDASGLLDLPAPGVEVVGDLLGDAACAQWIVDGAARGFVEWTATNSQRQRTKLAAGEKLSGTDPSAASSAAARRTTAARSTSTSSTGPARTAPSRSRRRRARSRPARTGSGSRSRASSSPATSSSTSARPPRRRRRHMATHVDGAWVETKASGQAISRLRSATLKAAITELNGAGYSIHVFPDNDNHIHIQNP